MKPSHSLLRAFPLNRSHCLGVALGVVVLVVAGPLLAAGPVIDLDDLKPGLEAVRVKYDLPGLGAAVVTDRGLLVLATTGVRKKGDTTPVTDDDLWHLGSCTKAMTATMIARLVQVGKLRFDQTLGETFPEHAGRMSDQVKSITLLELLSHTSGLPPNVKLTNYVRDRDPVKSCDKALVEATRTKLQSAPGEKYSYSNWGYILAGHMAEKATGKSWEWLMTKGLFEPLGMSTAGFGGTGTVGKIDQPWPHSAAGEPMPSNGPAMDNLPVMGPAGRVHLSLADWGKFVAEHLKGRRGQSEYLSQAMFEKLHTPVKEDYALGWIAARRPWAGGTALNHAGDNTMNYANVWVAPERGFAVLVVTNQSAAHAATDEVASGLIAAYVAAEEKRR